MQKIQFGDRFIGREEPCFLIAEAGVNHNGDINLAKKLIDIAREAGADAVKFQTFKAEEIVTKTAEKAAYQKITTGAEESQFDMIKKLELSPDSFRELSGYAKEKGILFISSSSGRESVDLLDEIGVPLFKIGSGELTNSPMLGYIARKQKPIILSTGMSTLGEIEYALKIIRHEGVEEIILLQCVSCYPAKIEDMNLKAMETLRYKFKLPVGLSDHSMGITVPVAAAALGACVIEKHFTLDKNLPGPDHRASLEPDELKQMIRAIRDVERAMGSGIKIPATEEEENKKVVRRSLVARVDIRVGAVITKDMLDIKRPGTGIEPQFRNALCGRRAAIDIPADTPITWEVLI